MIIFKINNNFLKLIILFIIFIIYGCSVYEKSAKVELQELEIDNINQFQDSFFKEFDYVNNYWQLNNTNNYIFNYELNEYLYLDFGEGEKEIQFLLSNPIIYDNYLYLIDNETLLTKIDIFNKKVVWKKEIKLDNSKNISWPVSLVNVNEYIFITTGDGNFYCIDFEGNIIWSKKFSITIRTASYSVNDLIIVILNNGEILALNYETGEQKWNFNKPVTKISSSQGGNIYEYKNNLIITSSKSQIHFIDYFFSEYSEIDNNFYDTFEPNNFDNIDYSIQTGIFKDKFIFIENFNSFSLFNLDTYEVEIDNLSIPENKYISILNNAIFSLSNENSLLSINIENGKIFWKKDLSNFLKKDNTIVKIINTNKNIIMFLSNGNIIYLNKINGSIEKTIKLKINDIKFVYLQKDFILFISKKAKVYIYN